MNGIPFYDEVYNISRRHKRFPEDYYGHVRPRRPRYRGSYVVDEQRTVNINDAKGNLRYQVKLTSEEVDLETEEETSSEVGYKIEVIHYYPDEDAEVILTIPEAEDDYIFDSREAKRAFETCVQRYDSLVRSEVKDFKDIDVYKDKIEYVQTEPECCRFCKWSREGHCKDRFGNKKLECHNPKNQQQFSYMVDFPEFPNRRAHRYCDRGGWKKLPWQKEIPHQYAGGSAFYGLDCDDPRHPDEVLNRIFPRVDQFGFCKNFEKLDKKHRRHCFDDDCGCDEYCDCSRKSSDDDSSEDDDGNQDTDELNIMYKSKMT